MVWFSRRESILKKQDFAAGFTGKKIQLNRNFRYKGTTTIWAICFHNYAVVVVVDEDEDVDDVDVDVVVVEFISLVS